MSVQTHAANSCNDVQDPYRFRRVAAQVAATSMKMLLTFEFGLCISFSGVVIPALTRKSNEHNANETLSITDTQASWIGSVLYICEPIGSLLSASIVDYLGRRRAMMVVNFPYAIAWFLMYRASSVAQIFIANSLLGFSIGLMEAAIMVYVGEICEPSLRGVLITYTNLGTPLGGAMIYFLNTQIPWRMVGLACMFVPITTLFALYFVPETPHWLLARGRTNQAEDALCWLRGWVPRHIVQEEFQTLQSYTGRAKSCGTCLDQNKTCTHPPPSLADKFADFKRKRSLKPFFIVISLFVILQFSGIFAMTPYLVQIFSAYQSPIEADVATAILSFLNIFATLTFMCLVRSVGKRRLYLTVLSGVCVSSFAIACYGFAVLPSGSNSFDKLPQVPFLENSGLVYIPTIFIILWSFCSFCGILMMPWQMLSEICPFKTKGLIAGIAAAVNYTMGFATVKTYQDLEKALSLPGIALFYSAIAICGLILMYQIMPETEGFTLDEIETHFSDDSKAITDWKIPKHKIETEKYTMKSSQLKRM